MIIKQIKVGKNNFYTVTFETGEKVKVSEDLLVRYRLLKEPRLHQNFLRN